MSFNSHKRLDDFSEMPREECGLFGIFDHSEAANHTYLGLYALQHRGQESAGIASSNGESLVRYRGMGLVADVFDAGILEHLPGRSAIGHVRYSTTGGSHFVNAQPLLINSARGQIAIAHNGDLVNTVEIRDSLEAEGAIFSTTTDSEVIVHLIARSRKESLEEAIIEALQEVRGSFALLILTKDKMFAIRDPQGLRPLCLGDVEGGTVAASETCAFDIAGADYLREVGPGEMVVVDREGIRSIQYAEPNPAYCIFEYIYYSRPDSRVFGHSVHEIRLKLGAQLHKESHIPADLVMPVPDSSNSAALGYARASGIPFEFGLIRSHYIGRTFIEPHQSIRDFGAKIKYNPVRAALEGKRAIVVDDSIVRGTTSRKIVRMLRKAGAKEVHLRISCPPWRHPCYFGIDTPTRGELIGSLKSVEEICEYVEADSLAYLSMEGLTAVAPKQAGPYCHACFSGVYPVKLGEHILEGKQKSICPCGNDNPRHSREFRNGAKPGMYE